MTFWESARGFRNRYQAPEGLFWIRRVNHVAGAAIALLLFPTRATPNGITVAGIAAHLTGALIVILAPTPAPIGAALLVLLIWQLAFSLDCADGPLARARGATSAFGAWFDQLADSISRSAVYGSLAIFGGRALAWSPEAAATLAASAVSLALLQTFSSWQRASIVGGGRPVERDATPMLRLVYASRHLVDYGAFLFVASVLLLWPPGLVAFLVLMTTVNGAFVMAQLALEWRRA